jgi:hypothetical protein
VTTKTKTRAKAAVLNEPTPAPIIGPQTEDEWLKVTYAAIMRKDATQADREEFRKALVLYPDLSKDYGDLPKMYRMFALERFEGQPIMQESIRHRLKVMRTELAGDAPSALELLLIDVVLSNHDSKDRKELYIRRDGEMGTGVSIERDALSTGDR